MKPKPRNLGKQEADKKGKAIKSYKSTVQAPRPVFVLPPPVDQARVFAVYSGPRDSSSCTNLHSLQKTSPSTSRPPCIKLEKSCILPAFLVHSDLAIYDINTSIHPPSGAHLLKSVQCSVSNITIMVICSWLQDDLFVHGNLHISLRSPDPIEFAAFPRNGSWHSIACIVN